MLKFIQILILLSLSGCDFSPSKLIFEKDVRGLNFPNLSGISVIYDDSLFYFVNEESKVLVTNINFVVREFYEYDSKYKFNSVFVDEMFIYLITSKNFLVKIEKLTKKITEEVNLNKIVSGKYFFRSIFFNPFTKTFILVNYGKKTIIFELLPTSFRLIKKYSLKNLSFVSSCIQNGNYAYFIAEKSQKIFQMKLDNLNMSTDIRRFNVANVFGIVF